MTTAAPAQLVVVSLGDGRYRVTGGREPHVVTIETDAATCGCADYTYRRRACKHLRAVWDYLVQTPLEVMASAGPGLERDVPVPAEPNA